MRRFLIIILACALGLAVAFAFGFAAWTCCGHAPAKGYPVR